jgi:rod shape-determining protein MreD
MGAYLSLSLPILVVAAALQASLAPQIRVLGGSPDFVLLTVLSWSANSEFDEALTWAIVGGIVQDLLSAAPTGTSAVGMIVLVFGVHLFNQRLYGVGFILLALLVVGGTVLKETITALILAIAGMYGDYLTAFSYVIVPSALYNLALLAPTYWLLRRIQKFFRRERRIF